MDLKVSEYLYQLYRSELEYHEQTLEEYDEIFDNLQIKLGNVQPKFSLYNQQPYLNSTIREKLVDFLLKMSTRLKLVPFVLFASIKLFDRYCCKRIVLLDHCQLIVTTCLWIAAKAQGGNSHFITDTNHDYRIISDLGFGTGGRFLGPTQRYRAPKLDELIKLCGAKCNYNRTMFQQMELHILETLNWQVNCGSIEDFILCGNEFNTIPSLNEEDGHELSRHDIFQIKQYLSYLSLYSLELVDVNIIHLAKVIIDLINETFLFSISSKNYQTINCNKIVAPFDIVQYGYIKKQLIKTLLQSSDDMVAHFDSKGPRLLFHTIFRNSMLRSPKQAAKKTTSPTSPLSSFCITKSKPAKYSDKPRSLDPCKMTNFQLNYVPRGSPLHFGLINALNGSITSTMHDNSEIFDRSPISISTPSTRNDSPKP